MSTAMVLLPRRLRSCSHFSTSDARNRKNRPTFVCGMKPAHVQW